MSTTVKSELITVRDMFGKIIEVTDLAQAIIQCRFCSKSHYIIAGKLVNGKPVTNGQYHQDLLTKLEAIKK